MATEKTASQKLVSEVGALLRARNALLWVVTTEEGRVERALVEAAAAAKFAEVRSWDCAGGVVDPRTGKRVETLASISNPSDPLDVLRYIRDTSLRSLWIMRDLPYWFRDPGVLRTTRSLARSLPSSPPNDARAVIVLSPSSDIPPELADHAIVVKWPLPDRAEVARIFDRTISSLAGGGSDAERAAEAERLALEYAPVREAAIDAALGLTAEAASSCYAKSLVTQERKIVPAIIAAEKRRVINQARGVEWFDPDPRGLAAVGGLENLKAWLALRKSAFSQRARDFGLPQPRGMLLVGLPGGGKSLTAKAVAAAWGVPLLKLDLGGARSKWVGESEANIRASLAVADTVGTCVLWIDEIEKALGGATQGAADGGVSSDALGTLLSWMQERRGSVFVVATANDVQGLPPELLRKGRFDEVFWVDLPTPAERAEILRVALRQYGRGDVVVDIDGVAAACDSFVGAEIAALVPAALFVAFADGERELRTSDLLAEARATVPLAKTASAKISALREWAKGRARSASVADSSISAVSDGGRNLDL